MQHLKFWKKYMENVNKLIKKIEEFAPLSTMQKWDNSGWQINLGNKTKTPSSIARDSQIKMNHVSMVLKALKEKKLIICLNEDSKKGRLYQMTDLGKQVAQAVKNIE